MAYASTIFSGAASLGVLIGLISGIFFLVLTALKWVSRVQANLYEEELNRKKRFLLNNGHGMTGFPEARLSENGIKHALDETNFQNKDQQSAESAAQWSENQKHLEASENQEPNTNTVKVRELIEKMVEAIIGGPLDGTTVGQLSTHPTYLDMFAKYHNMLCRELAKLGFALHLSVVRRDSFDLSTDLKQSNLKRLITRILSEAMALPNIKEILSRPKTSKEPVNEDFENKSYEDILATAILNKIIENAQNQQQKENQTFERTPKPRFRNKKRRNRVDDLHFDGDWSDTSRSDQLSLTIEEYIEEVTTALDVSDNEDSDLSDYEKISNRRIPFPESGKTVVDGTDDENSDLEEQNTATELITSTNSWEENWLFQKKRLRSTPNAHHPVPVPMLVPNPSEDFRALVGGVDADELSDMSDCSELILEDLPPAEESSELLNQEEESIEKFNTEGENKIGKVKQIENIIREESFCESKDEEAFNNRISAKESDEKYENNSTTVEEEETTVNSPSLPEDFSPKDRDSSIKGFPHQYELVHDDSPSEGSIKSSIETEDLNRRCSIAEKEKEKWMNPVPLSENPYSLENIEKREKRKKNDFFRIGTYTGELITFPNDIPSDELFEKETEKLRFSRDYYVNASKNPSGKSSPSPTQSQNKIDQKFPDMTLPKEEKFEVHKIQEKTNEELAKDWIVIDKKQFHLPNVKELAKQFTMDGNKDLQRVNGESQTKLESKHNPRSVSSNEFPEKELEIDYSTIPVSKIINSLQKNEPPICENQPKAKIYDKTQPTTRMEIHRKVDNTLITGNPTEEMKTSELARFNGKQVHSLTARSISKEFREGLKNNQKISYKNFSKPDRISSGGESDQGDVICDKNKTPPTPTINLKNMKKFWEEIITANSNSTKQK